MLIRIELPRDRDYCGRLNVLRDGATVFGPVWCAGRADDAAALHHGNESRSYLLPYGDTPPGSFRLRRIVSMRGASDHALSRFGRFGIAVLGATGGAALMADSVGRFEIWIHGGASPLSCTNGSVRLTDQDFFGFVSTIKGAEGACCEIVETDRVVEAPSVRLEEFDAGDPPSLKDTPAVRSWPVPTEAAVPLRTIFLGEYDGGSADSSGGGAAMESSPVQIADTDTPAPASSAEPDPVKTTESSLDAQVDSPSRRSGGWGEAITGFFRSFFRDTTVRHEMRDVDDRLAAPKDVEAEIAARFDVLSARKLAQLPTAVRAALLELAQAYGAAVDEALPQFWAAATSGQWHAAVQVLLRTKDDHGPARTRAADLLQGAINSGALG